MAKQVKRAISLAGGGPAAGLHIGVLKELEKQGKKFDVWALSCIGAWVGIVYNQHDHIEKKVDHVALRNPVRHVYRQQETLPAIRFAVEIRHHAPLGSSSQPRESYNPIQVKCRSAILQQAPRISKCQAGESAISVGCGTSAKESLKTIGNDLLERIAILDGY